MSLENAQSATIQSDATRPSLWAGRVFHRVHGEVDPTGCFRALPRRVKRILGLYNYIEPFFSQNTGSVPHRKTTERCDEWGEQRAIGSRSQVVISILSVNR